MASAADIILNFCSGSRQALSPATTAPGPPLISIGMEGRAILFKALISGLVSEFRMMLPISISNSSSRSLLSLIRYSGPFTKQLEMNPISMERKTMAAENGYSLRMFTWTAATLAPNPVSLTASGMVPEKTLTSHSSQAQEVASQVLSMHLLSPAAARLTMVSFFSPLSGFWRRAA